MKVLFVGDPVLDIICHASEQLLQELDFAPGGCDHINEDGLNRILSRQSLQEIQLRYVIPACSLRCWVEDRRSWVRERQGPIFLWDSISLMQLAWTIDT